MSEGRPAYGPYRLFHRGYKCRLYPNEAQRVALARTFGSARYVFNWALARRRDLYRESGERVGLAQLSKELTALRKAEGTDWLSEVLRVPLQSSLLDLDRAYSNFFAGRAAFPRFKKKGSAQSVRYVSKCFRVSLDELTLQKVPGVLRFRSSRGLPCTPSSCTVSVDAAGRYFVSFLCLDHIEALLPCEAAVGVDLGLTHFATLSTGEKVENPRHLEKKLDRLRREQRRLSRKVRGSANYGKQRRRVAVVHAKVADQRRDFLHKLSTRLIHENQAVAVETLNVSGMMRNHSLARHIGGAGWAEFDRMLTYKAEWYGREVYRVGRFFASSKTCSSCGAPAASMSLKVRTWTCGSCGTEHDRDVNAALNILAARDAVVASGGDRRPRADPFAQAAPDEGGTRP